MTGEEQFGWRPWPRALIRCRAEDVLIAFRVVGHEIRAKYRRLGDTVSAQAAVPSQAAVSSQAAVPTQGDVCRLALRIKDQRDLIRQLSGRHNRKHVRRLVRLNRKHRRRLEELVDKTGLDPSVLIFK